MPENPRASDTRFEDNLLDLVSSQTLLLLDRGFYHFQFWQQLIERKIHLITRIKINATIEYQQVFTDGSAIARSRFSESVRERKILPL